MALELPGISVKSRVSSFEAQREPRGCGCCSLPDTGDPARSRRRGCASPAPSRGTSPARAKPGAPGPQSGGRPGAGRRDIDKTLLSLLLIFHRAEFGEL
ncbi:transmembrane protein PVRIG-like [Platysternon megacephalum]|uniref:Transmembrane protein PVRIG-like n=1 Tax=Platysternon megacephalum TaxID=55544 RepID=A0A4D9DTA7_9SAUR|nr:transmembrane protein PVRIG-like [Platysternon megacephalum]